MKKYTFSLILSSLIYTLLTAQTNNAVLLGQQIQYITRGELVLQSKPDDIYDYPLVNLRNGGGDIEEELQTTLATMHNLLDIKGLSAAVHMPDGTVWAGAAGVSALDPTDSLTVNHRFAMGSITKSFIAACVLNLRDEGLLRLDDMLLDWLPTYPNVDSTITIRQLLQHRSGVSNYTDNPSFNPTIGGSTAALNKIWTGEEIVTTFVTTPDFAVGTAFGYSNTNYTLLAMIIEAVTGRPFTTEVLERIIAPAGLRQTFMPLVDNWQQPIAHLWLDTNGDNIVEDFHQTFISWNSLLSTISAAGGYFTTPSDLVKFMQQLHGGDLLNEESRMEMQAGRNAPQLNLQYGLGTMINTFAGYQGMGHGGDISYSSQAYYLPELDISISVQANDGSVNSWNLIGTVGALARTYANAQVTSTPNLAEISLKTFPNPVNDWLHIETGATAIRAVELLDVNGRNVELKLQNNQTYNLAHLPAGVYFLRVQTEQGIDVQKLVKR